MNQGKFLTRFLHFKDDAAGQDLIEYTLILAAAALAVVALLMSCGYSVGNIWGSTHDLLTQASHKASGDGGGSGGNSSTEPSTGGIQPGK